MQNFTEIFIKIFQPFVKISPKFFLNYFFDLLLSLQIVEIKTKKPGLQDMRNSWHTHFTQYSFCFKKWKMDGGLASTPFFFL